MKALKIVTIIFSVIGVLVLVFWLGFLRAPSPESVCAHVNELTMKEAGAKLSGRLRGLGSGMLAEQCVRQLQPPKYGLLRYAKQMRCINSADSVVQLESCTAR